MDSLRKNLKLYIIGLFFCLNLLVWYAVFSEERNVLTVAFLDVGQGDAIFIEAPNGKQILIDGGQNRQVLRGLSKMMPFYDRTIDVVLLTHPDADHVGGLPAVLESYDVSLVLEPGVISESGVYIEFLNIIEEKGIEKVLARQGMKIPLCDYLGAELPNCDLYLEVLFPVNGTKVSEFDVNTASVVTKLVYKNTSFLFTGDSPKSIEKYLVSVYGDAIDVDVLKLGHHGSKTSTSDVLLGFASPDIAIVSAGEDNRYGHPHKEVVDLLESFEIDILRTYEEGNIVIESDGDNIFVK